MALQVSLPADQITHFCQKHHIRKLMLFGSVLREDFTPDSDIDVLVEFEADAGITYFDLADAKDELSRLLGRDVDIGTLISLSPYIRDRVLASAKVIYERG
jgi:hypothetical protein